MAGQGISGQPLASRPDLPLVSICIPAYNAERFIRQTLESALAQDYPNLEIIVSDDASTDDTPEIVQQYESKGVYLIQQEKRLGIYGNYNAAILASSGKYICKLDADDILEPQYVSSMVNVMEAHPKIAFSHCACRLIDVDGNFLGYERSIHGSFIRSGLQEWPRYIFGPLAVNIVMIRRSSFDAVNGYDDRFASSGDWKMHRDLLRIGDVFYNDRILAKYRCHDSGKKGRLLVRAWAHLLHLKDMELIWPPGVPDKERLMQKTRRHQARYLLNMAVLSEPEEAQELLDILPQYGRFPSLMPRAWLIRRGGAGLLRFAYRIELRLRQMVKKLLYKGLN